MLDITIVNGVFKPTYNYVAPPCCNGKCMEFNIMWWDVLCLFMGFNVFFILCCLDVMRFKDMLLGMDRCLVPQSRRILASSFAHGQWWAKRGRRSVLGSVEVFGVTGGYLLSYLEPLSRKIWNMGQHWGNIMQDTFYIIYIYIYPINLSIYYSAWLWESGTSADLYRSNDLEDLSR